MNAPNPINPNDWPIVRSLLEQAIELPQNQRQEFIAIHAPNPRIQSLVHDHLAKECALDQLEAPPPIDAHPLSQAAPTPAPTDPRVGPYELLSKIGAGGMGVVYRAHRADGQFDRTVAVKFLNSLVAGDRLRHHFDRERRALAKLSHPNIATLLDGGTTPAGAPYIVMECVDGAPIDRHCRDHNATIEDRLRLIIKLCHGVQHAHQSLIIHRDLKPSNILVTPEGEPKILDFGLAKLLNDTPAASPQHQNATTLHAVTPAYASPEHLQGKTITTVSDIYAIGVILYELLTDQSPHANHADSPFHLIHRACHSDPTPPSRAAINRRRAKRLAGDLDIIVLKAMNADPARRYSSAEALAQDIQRHLDGIPVSAQRDTLLYRASKFVKRNRTLTTVSTAAALALILSTIITTRAMLDAKSAQRTAEAQQRAAINAKHDAEQISEFLKSTLITANPYRLARPVGVLELLDIAQNRIDEELRRQPRVEAAARLAIGKSYAGLWEWARARPQLRQALDLLRTHDPENKLALAECLSILGRAETFAQNPRCVDLQKEGLAIRRNLFGPDHPTVAESLGNLGYAYWFGIPNPAEKQWDKAAEHYAAAIDINQRHFDTLTLDQKRDLARFTFSFGVMRSAQNQKPEAERLMANALTLYRSINGSGDRYMVACLNRYGWLLHGAGRLNEAHQILSEAIANTPKELYPDTVVCSAWTIAAIRLQQNDPADALSAATRAIAMECRHLAAANDDHAARFLQNALELESYEEDNVPNENRANAVKQIIAARRRAGSDWNQRARILINIANANDMTNLAQSVAHLIDDACLVSKPPQ